MHVGRTSVAKQTYTLCHKRGILAASSDAFRLSHAIQNRSTNLIRMHGGFSCHSKALYIEQYIKENYKKATLSASGPTREATSINGRAADVTNKVANPTQARTSETLRGMNLTDQCRRELK